MTTLAKNILVGLAGLAIAGAPLAANAQDWHNDHNRGSVQRHDNRGHDVRHGERYHVNYSHPVYRRSYANGYYGVGPSGWLGYYNNGRWYHHRRMNAGLWIYF